MEHGRGTEPLSISTITDAPWLVESARLTVLNPEKTPSGLWQGLTGSSPESITQQTLHGLTREEGPWEGGLLVTEVRPDRFDVVLGLSPTSERVIPSIGAVDDVLPKFTAVCSAWLAGEHLHRASRIALGSTLLCPVESRIMGYERLQRFLPFQLDAEAQDFFYQINRRRASEVQTSLQLNRLSRWSVAQWQFLHGTLPGPITPIAEALTACRLDVDINTAPEFTRALDSATLQAVLAELRVLMVEIYTKGDVK